MPIWILNLIGTKWGKALIGVLGAAVILAGFYFWSYNRGFSAAKDEYASAALVAEREAGRANRSALGREMEAATRRAVEETELRNVINAHNADDDDSPAPAIVQRVYDRLRGQDGGRP